MKSHLKVSTAVTESVLVGMVPSVISSESFIHSPSSRSSTDNAFVTESLPTTSPEIKHQWEISKISTISIKVKIKFDSFYNVAIKFNIKCENVNQIYNFPF